MASHDTEIRKLRAASQDDAARVQKLNQELRKLKEHIDHEALEKNATKHSDSNTRKPKG